jgi:hypothetical protein
MKRDYTICLYSIPHHNKNIFPLVQHTKNLTAMERGKNQGSLLYLLRKRMRESTARLDRWPATDSRTDIPVDVLTFFVILYSNC